MKKILSMALCFTLLLMTASCSSSGTDASASSSAKASSGDINTGFTFTTTDRSGTTYTEEIFAQSKVTMINMWESWCGPCVREMPDLERLYENYKDKGLNIIGIYSNSSDEEDVDIVLQSAGVMYPILRYSNDFEMFRTGKVPTTFFVDSEGHVITTSTGARQIIGANSYANWESLVQMLLGE